MIWSVGPSATFTKVGFGLGLRGIIVRSGYFPFARLSFTLIRIIFAFIGFTAVFTQFLFPFD
jgi:hypothetical protein